MPTSPEIRRQFIDFFVRKHGHTFVPSSPVVPHGDPTLLFANAGMNQFKNIFLGTVRRDYTRAANTQKCIRAGGKHNDLDDVGKDTYHHTFFEMLGNWSFGDYFKKEAIDWAWELLVAQWGVDASRLHATYFRGDPAENVEPDTEARECWLKHLPPERIHAGSKKDNFWEMGDTGPCGPCSEIHIDLTPDKTGGNLVNAGNPHVIEIWNLVFMQFNRAPGVNGRAGTLSPLPARHVDTGMGFERITRVLQGKSSNYDIDLFTSIFAAIQQATGARPYAKRLDDHIDIAYRVIADHIRCLTFAITDGAVPGNEGRGYVLRRILRRAVRHGRQTLGVKDPFFYKLVPAVVDAMGDAFGELKTNPQYVMDVLKDEEISFGRTIDRGIDLFEDAARRAATANGGQAGAARISADDAFKLHDTYGFPLDLTQVMAEERGMAVDVEGFATLMEQARQTARAGGSETDLLPQLMDLAHKAPPPATEFIGYDATNWTGRTFARKYDLGELTAVATARTPFYAEAGGQVGDQGEIRCGTAVLQVSDTIKVGNTHFHIGRLQGQWPDNTEPELTFTVNIARRNPTMANHTATHIMNHKLRAVLGEHIQQKGSLVDAEKLRFDFSHPTAVSTEQIGEIDRLVNADIAADLRVFAAYAPQEQALKISGLRAVFGEKYPPRVRVISVGVPVEQLLQDPANAGWRETAIEFCGGTHLKNTGAARRFVIVSEEAVGKGLRRITALTGAAAEAAIAAAEALMAKVESLKQAADPAAVATGLTELTAAINDTVLPATVRAKLRDGLAELQKVAKEHQKQQSKAAAGNAVEEARKIADAATGSLIVAEVAGADADALRSAMDVIRKRCPNAALLLAGAVAADKVSFVAAVPPDLIKKGLKAGDWVREVAKIAGGGGGGRPDMAQAGGKDQAKLAAALEPGKRFAEGKLLS